MRSTTRSAGPSTHGASEPAFGRAIVQRLGTVASQRAEELLGEIPATLRRVRTFLLVATVCVPILVVGLIAVFWRLAS
jgi:hypothetical protein